MKVLKFGGSSVGSAEGLQNIKSIVQGQSSPTIVVVSALGGVTDQLIELSELAHQGVELYHSKFLQLTKRHHSIIEKSIAPERQEQLKNRVDALLTELKEELSGLSSKETLTPEISATVVSYGEQLSSLIVSQLLEGSRHLDSTQIIKTHPYFNRHIIDFSHTNFLITKNIECVGGVIVMGGFISSDSGSGAITNLGRGGSDYTAAVVAAAVNAEQLDIYTDVDGFMTADPRIVPDAYLINQLSFVEAMDLCNFGAKIIYPPTIFPAYNRNIPIEIRNTYNPTCGGSRISSYHHIKEDSNSVKGLSYIAQSSLIAIHGIGIGGVVGRNYRIFRTLSQAGVTVTMISHEERHNSILIGINSSASEVALPALCAEFSEEILSGHIEEPMVEAGLSLIAIVGERLHTVSTLAGELLGLMGRGGIPIKAYSQNQTNISFITEASYLPKALNTLHQRFFISKRQEVTLFLAGEKPLLDTLNTIITHHNQPIKERSRVFSVGGQCRVGLSILGSETAINQPLDFCQNRGDDSQQDFCQNKGDDSQQIDTNINQPLDFCQNRENDSEQIDDFISSIERANAVNGVLIDSSDSIQIVRGYKRVLNSKASIISSNKSLALLPSIEYAELKEIAQENRLQLFIKSVLDGAQTAIQTLNDLHNSGDRILSIESSISSPLNWVLETLQAGECVESVINRLLQMGYSNRELFEEFSTEAEKARAVILARESGYKAEVQNVTLVDELVEISQIAPRDSSSLNKIVNLLSTKVANLDNHKRLRVISTINPRESKIELREIEPNTPFYFQGCDQTIILIRSERYHDYPLQLKEAEERVTGTSKLRRDTNQLFNDLISITGED